MTTPEHIVFITGKLAEPALRRQLTEFAPKVGFHFDIAVMPITVAALLTTDWIARRLHVPATATRLILPGLCRGDLTAIQSRTAVPVQLGPKDLRDLPEFFGQQQVAMTYGEYDIEILAEINHAPQLSRDDLLKTAKRYAESGADIIDLGCDPGGTWHEIGHAVRALVQAGHRVSVDSFNTTEVELALAAGARLVLSVNSTNVQHVQDWQRPWPHVEVVAIPDTPTDVDSLLRTVETLDAMGARYRVDPILDPIGFGFAASLGRYLDVRRRLPDAEMMLGVGNLTELTDVDSSGVNVMLAGFCQEVGIRSVLATEVINWGRSAVKEFALARQLVFHAVKNQVLPKRLSSDLILLRDPKLYTQSQESLSELSEHLTDRNYRLFAEAGELHVMNGQYYLRGTDPFALFEQMMQRDNRLDPGHSFYLGYEFAKAVTALTLGKHYEQDRALRWGFLTVPEVQRPDRAAPA